MAQHPTIRPARLNGTCIYGGRGPDMCMDDAAPGSDYCPTHDPDRQDFDEDLAHDMRLEDAA